MTSSRRNLAAGAAAIALCACVFAGTAGSQAQEPEGNYGIGIPDVFLPKYLTYRAQQLNSSTPNVMRIRLGYVKGLSRSFTAMVGEAAVNLQTGAFQVSLNGLTPLQTYSVWLVDRSESDLVPPVPDTVFGLITFFAVKPSTLLSGVLPLNLPVGFTLDRVVVSTGLLWGTEALAAGSVNVFQKIFFRRLSLLNDSTGAFVFDETTSPPSLSALVPDLAGETDGLASMGPVPGRPVLALAGLRLATFSPTMAGTSSPRLVRTASARQPGGGSVKLDKLISQGAKLFFEETFKGNGRTCGTCHPASNNFTIDRAFIATLPPTDPLFVAEFNPALAGLERPALMKKFGLILENLDGLSDPTNKFVMRGVPHTLGLQVSLTRHEGLVPPAPAEMTGWSGDGAPGTGSLREFAIGAVTQHFTKRLDRVEGTDFKLPKEHQLDAMEAFQLSLGRSADFTLANITFTDANANAGKSLFTNGGSTSGFGGTCNFCHTNAGALSAVLGNQNRNFNTNVEAVTHPARGIENFPRDGGFGQAANPPPDADIFGNRTFNTPPVVEAADTAPFFHNNVVETLEGVVDFYTGPEFDNSQPTNATRFRFTTTERDQIVVFMRGVNTLQNIDVARRELEEILANQGNPQGEQATRLQTAFDETQDALDVLDAGGIFPSAETLLVSAQDLIEQAQDTNDPNQRRTLIAQAIAQLRDARLAVDTNTP